MHCRKAIYHSAQTLPTYPPTTTTIYHELPPTTTNYHQLPPTTTFSQNGEDSSVGSWKPGNFAFHNGQVCKVVRIISRNTVAIVIGKGVPSTPVACSQLRRVKIS
jgi:hypothetical protein